MLAAIVGIPTAVFAQASIAGSVSDPFGVPISGVLVEASSPALIEKVRTTVTDDAGRYRIENLLPGTYVVRFALDGWTTYQKEAIELRGSLTATIDAALQIGRVTDMITVRGETPVVDVYGARREVTLSGEIVQSIPTARSYNALLVLIPGVVTNVNDTVMGTSTTSFPIHGGRANEGRLLLDGLNVGSASNGNSATSYTIDIGQAREVTFTTAGALGESETAGLVMNVVPKSGGNTTRGSLFASGTGSKLQSNNVTPELAAQGVMTATPFSKVYDVSGTFGGPIVRDRLWYFMNGHIGGSTRDVPGVYYNLNAGNASQWLYAPDFSHPEYSDRTFENASGRVTWQVTPRNKVSGTWDAQALCRTCTGATPGLAEPQRVSPEAVGVLGRRLDVTQVSWSSPVTNRLFLEAGYGGTYLGVGNFERDPNPTRDLIRVAEQCASGCPANGSIPGLVYRSQDFSVAHTGSYLWKGSLSYVTGAHSLKIGYQHTLMTDDRTWMTNNQNLTYRVDNGEPNQLTQSISPWVNNARAGWDGLFVQEQWTGRRLTLQGAVRFDRARSWFPEQQEGTLAVPACADRRTRNARRGQLQRHHSKDRSGIRRVWNWQDRHQDRSWQVSGWRRYQRQLRQHQSDAAYAADDDGVRDSGGDKSLDRRKPQLGARLRSAEPGRTGSPCDWRRSLWCALEYRLREARFDKQLRSGDSRGVGCPAFRLESRRLDSAADWTAVVS
jgi:hypothetical protein